MTHIIVLLLAISLSGCSMMQPTAPQLTNYSDQGVLEWSNNVMGFWATQTGGSVLLGYGGAISLAGLSIGTLMAATAGSPAAPGLAMGSALVSWVLAILKPTGHANAIMTGATIVLAAQQTYFVERTAAGISMTPANCMTTYGGVLAGAINSAISTWLRLNQALAPVDPQLPAQGRLARDSNNKCGL